MVVPEKMNNYFLENRICNSNITGKYCYRKQNNLIEYLRLVRAA